MMMMSILVIHNKKMTYKPGSSKNGNDDHSEKEQIRPLERDEVLIDKRHASIGPRAYDLKETIPVHGVGC